MMSFLTLGVSKFAKKFFVKNKEGTSEEALKYNGSSIPERPSLIGQENSTSLWNYDWNLPIYVLMRTDCTFKK